MKITLIILSVVLLSSFKLYPDKFERLKSSERSMTETDSSINVQVKLIDSVKRNSFCGPILVKQSYQYELLQINDFKLYQPRNIKIEFTCPREMSGFYFQTGYTYWLKVKGPKAAAGINIPASIVNAIKTSTDDLPTYIFVSG